MLCQYNNIYAGSYKYLKEKKNTNGRLNKKKKNSVATIATVPLEQTKSGTIATVQNLREKKCSLHQKGHCKGIASFYIVSRKKSTNW